LKRSLAIGFLMLTSSFSLYAAKNTQTVVFPTAVQVGAANLPAGEYKATWTGTGAELQLTIDAKGQKAVTVPAHSVQQKNFYNGSITTGTVNGKQVLQTIMLEKSTIVIDAPKVSGN